MFLPKKKSLEIAWQRLKSERIEREIQRSKKELWFLTGWNSMLNLAIHLAYRSFGITFSARTEELLVCFHGTFGTCCFGLWYHLQRQVLSSICIITHLQRDKTHTTTISNLFGHLISHPTMMESEACEISTSTGELSFLRAFWFIFACV